MLVCNVSLRPPRTAIAAVLAEVATAADATATGNIVFATLVDDPASVGDLVDAYLGEIMLEAASATAVADAGLTYGAAIDEDGTVIDAWNGAVPTVYTGAITEAVTATASPDASIAGADDVTTTSSTAAGPLFWMDTTFPSVSVTVINAGTV